MLTPQELAFIVARLEDTSRGLRPLVVSAPTGSGKSTNIGLLLSLRYIQNSVWVVVPSILAATNLYHWAINMKSNLKIGLFAGDRSQGADVDTAQLLYTTTGTMINQLFRALNQLESTNKTPPVKLPGHLILDEIHLRRIDEFLVMALWQRLTVKQNYVGPRLILTSATIDPQQQYTQASDFLGLSEKNLADGQYPDMRPQYSDFVIINRELPITNRPVEQDFSSLYDPRRWNAMIIQGRLFTQQLPIISQSKYPGRGNILFLVPGIEEARRVQELAEEEIKQHALTSVSVMMFHAGISGADKQAQLNNLRHLTKDKTTWIISTGMGTTSLTFPHLLAVIDSMLAKRRVLDPGTQNTIIKTELINREEYIQRRGRVGREMPGTYISMITQESINKLSISGQSEVETLPLGKISLRLILHKIDPNEIWQSSIDSGIVLSQRWDRTNEEIKQLKLINDQQQLTPAGRFVIKTSFQLRPAVLLWKWIHKYSPWPGVVLAALINNYGPYWAIYKRRDQSAQKYAEEIQSVYKKYYLNTTNDMQVLLNMWNALMEKSDYLLAYFTPLPQIEQTSDYHRQLAHEARQLSWAITSLKLDPNKIRKLIYQVRQNAAFIFRWTVQNKRNNFVIAKFTAEDVSTAAQDFYRFVYYDRILTREKNHYVDANNEQYYIDASSVMRQYKPDELITLGTLQLPKARFVRLGVTSIPIKKMKDPRIPLSEVNLPSKPAKVKILKRNNLPTDPAAYTSYTPQMMLIYEKDVHLRQALRYYNANIPRYLPDQIGLGNLTQLFSLQNIITPDNPRAGTFVYPTRDTEISSVIGWGQRKLFLAVFEFLLLTTRNYPNALVVYVGAAPGTNIKLLSVYFPNLRWHLYDPRDFATGLENIPQITIYKQLFTSADAARYVSRTEEILFISDIRQKLASVVESEGPLRSNENKIADDIQLQKEWVEQIQPAYSHLKFRMPFYDGTTQYFVGLGDLVQPWAKRASTETRLIVTPIDIRQPVGQRQFNYRMYNHNAYEETLYHYNTEIRTSYFEAQTIQLKLPDHDCSQLDHCFDCFQEVSLWQYYFQYVRGNNFEQAQNEIPNAVQNLSTTIDPRRNLLTYKDEKYAN